MEGHLKLRWQSLYEVCVCDGLNPNTIWVAQDGTSCRSHLTYHISPEDQPLESIGGGELFNNSADGRVPKAWEGGLLEKLERNSRSQNLGVARGVSFSNLRKQAVWMVRVEHILTRVSYDFNIHRFLLLINLFVMKVWAVGSPVSQLYWSWDQECVHRGRYVRHQVQEEGNNKTFVLW